MWETPEIVVATSVSDDCDLQIFDLSKTCMVISNYSVGCDHISCCKKYGMDDRIIVENDVTNFICELAKMQFVQII